MRRALRPPEAASRMRTCRLIWRSTSSLPFRGYSPRKTKGEGTAMSDQFVAEIRIFPFNFAPKGWATCDGQIMPISQNTALFSLLGTTYGGDGKSTFALPDMQGNAPMQPGQAAGGSDHFLGETGGSATVTLLQSEMPQHVHSLMAAI